MIGRSMEVLEAAEEVLEHAERPAGATPLLQVVGLGRKGSVQPFDLELYEGEVVGLAGLLGSGRTELARLLTGADRADVGRDPRGRRGRPACGTPRAAMGHGIAYTSEDRKGEGVVDGLTVRENIVLALQARARLDAAAAPQAGRRAGRHVHRAARHPARQPRGAAAQPLGRQPAEGAARAVARHGAAAARPGRADPRHRRRRQGRDPEARRRPGGRGHVRRLHLGRARRSAAHIPPHRRDARPSQGGGDRRSEEPLWTRWSTSSPGSGASDEPAAPLPLLAGRRAGRPAGGQHRRQAELPRRSRSGTGTCSAPRSTSCGRPHRCCSSPSA